MAAHLASHLAVWHAGQDALHERMSSPSHHRTSTGFQDGLFHVHRTFHIVHDAQVLVVGSILGQSVLISKQIVGEQGEETVRIDEAPFFVNRSDAVAVSVGAHPEFAVVLHDGFPEIDHVLRSCRVGAVVGFCGVPIAVKVDVVDAHFVQKLSHEWTGDSVSTVNCHLDVSSKRSGGRDDRIKVVVHVGVIDDFPCPFPELARQEDILEFLNFFTGQW